MKKVFEKKHSRDILFQSITTVFFTIFGFICFYPFYYILIYSISNPLQLFFEQMVLLNADAGSRVIGQLYT